MKLRPYQINSNTGVITIEAGWKPIIERCCELKEAIDHASRWPDTSPWRNKAEGILKLCNLSIGEVPSHEELGGNFPQHFAQLLGGEAIFGFRTLREECIPDAILPGWATLGWVRKDNYPVTPTLPASQLIQIAGQLPIDSSTYAVEGIPLFMGSEGKNRTQLQRFSGATRTTYLRVFPNRDISHLCARPLSFALGIVVLEVGDAYELLPFRRVSQPLLAAIGVPWSDRPSFKPWFGQALFLGKPWDTGSCEKRLRIGLLKQRKS